MRQNRSRLSSKTDQRLIDNLKNDLMSKINNVEEQNIIARPRTSFRGSKGNFYSEKEDL
jgi:hypothetical protein